VFVLIKDRLSKTEHLVKQKRCISVKKAEKVLDIQASKQALEKDSGLYLSN